MRKPKTCWGFLDKDGDKLGISDNDILEAEDGLLFSAIPASAVEKNYVHKGRIKTEIVIFRSKIWNELSEKITKKEMDAIRNLSLELEMKLGLILKRKHRK